tara:strand:+ start:3970 stop:6123 length:2154 start_codon:yes stop_codon:yes gene_type:complete
MAKVLPAGANVNLGLGEDPMDRLLKTIQVASQAQGVINQATLQRDRREAIQLDNVKSLMTNAVNTIDYSDSASVSEGENQLNIMAQQYIQKYPELTADIEGISTTFIAQNIKPKKDLHNNFARDKKALDNALETIDNEILSLDDELILNVENNVFKDDFVKLGKILANYKLNSSNYQSIMPEQNTELAMDVARTEALMETLPDIATGIFDAREKQLVSDFINGRTDANLFDQAMKQYYKETSGKIANQFLPALKKEMDETYAQYSSLWKYKEDLQREGNTDDAYRVASLDDGTEQVIDKFNFFKDLTGAGEPDIKSKEATGYIDDEFYVLGQQFGSKEDAISFLDQQLQSLQNNVENKDIAYRRYKEELGNTGDYSQLSYASDANPVYVGDDGVNEVSGQYLWDYTPGLKTFRQDVQTGGAIGGAAGDATGGATTTTPGAEDEEGGPSAGVIIGGIALTGLVAEHGSAVKDLGLDIYRATQLSSDQIAEIIESPGSQKTMGGIKKLDSKIEKIEDLIKNKKDVKVNKVKLDQLNKQRTSRIDKIVTRYSKKFGVDKKIISKAFDRKLTNKYINFYSLKNKIGKLAQKSSKYILPYTATTAIYETIRPEASGYEEAAVGLAGTYTANKLYKKIVKNSDKIVKILKKKGRKTAAKAVTSFAAGTTASGGSLAIPAAFVSGLMFVYDLADIGYDIYEMFSEDEVEAIEQQTGKPLPDKED